VWRCRCRGQCMREGGGNGRYVVVAPVRAAANPQPSAKAPSARVGYSAGFCAQRSRPTVLPHIEPQAQRHVMERRPRCKMFSAATTQRIGNGATAPSTVGNANRQAARGNMRGGAGDGGGVLRRAGAAACCRPRRGLPARRRWRFSPPREGRRGRAAPRSTSSPVSETHPQHP